MEEKHPVYYNDVAKCADDIIRIMDKKIIFGMPLALGKPIQLINELYRRAKADPSISLTIVTALSLEKPTWSNDLERRFLKPFVDRVWKDIPDFDYILDIRKKQMASNVILKEFYFKAGQYVNVPEAQQNSVSSNYTHAVRDSLDNGINVFAHIAVKKKIGDETYISASCNADTSLDALYYFKKAQQEGKKVLAIGMMNTNLPFMYGDAIVKPEIYDMIIENNDYNFPLFSVPRPVVSNADHMIGIHVSTLIKDGGTLQIGIGALGDAIASGLKMRHENNDQYQAFLDDAKISATYQNLITKIGGTTPFEKGLYGSTEMFVDCFLQLYKIGILKRKVYHDTEIQRLLNEGHINEKVTGDTFEILLEKGVINLNLTNNDFNKLQKFGIFKEELIYENSTIIYGDNRFSTDLNNEAEKNNIIKNCLGTHLKGGINLTGAFFIGPRDFYESLRNMSEEERKLFEMTAVTVANQLYGNEDLRRVQRIHGRFINTGMIATLFGNVASDMLEDGTVISGVGGQYNFVAMAHALHDARSIIMIKSTRSKGKNVLSNILFNYGHTTIPRHLRDIVITEYGIADLRGKSNKDCIAEMINIADSRFQEELLNKAKSLDRIPRNYQIPDRFRNNYPQKLDDLIVPYRKKGFFKAFPFETDLTKDEIVIGKSLRIFKEKIAGKDITIIPDLALQFFKSIPESAKPYLERMELTNPSNTIETILQKIVVYALSSAGQI